MSQSSGEKTEDATPKRLREARKKGQVPKSKDVSMLLVMVAEVIILGVMVGMISMELQQLFKLCFEAIANNQIEWSSIYDLGKASAITLAKALIPMFVAGCVMATLAGFMQVGAIFASDPLTPKPERLNPIEGIKNMFKVVALVELIKNILKIIVVFYIAYSVFQKYFADILNASKVDIFSAALVGGYVFFEFFLKVILCFMFIAGMDYAMQRWNFMKNMRMTKDEVKREYKQDEGDPQIKGERRRLHREMAFGDTRKAVKKADVVVTNPVHVACVLEYNREEMGAPTLTAKGQLKFAESIVQMAQEEGIPIIRNIPLAWALLPLEIGDEIPEELFETVAEVLTIVYEMKQNGGKVAEPVQTSPNSNNDPKQPLYV